MLFVRMILGDWRNWERSSFASFSQEFESPILHQGITMKYNYMKTSWFMGVPFLWNTLHNSAGKDVKIFRFGPVLIRVEKDDN